MRTSRALLAALALALLTGDMSPSAHVDRSPAQKGAVDREIAMPSLETPIPPTPEWETEAGAARPPTPPERVHGSFIVRLAAGLDPAKVAPELARDYGGHVNFVYDAVLEGFEFRGPDDAGRRLAQDPRVRAADPNYTVHTADTLNYVNQVHAPVAWNTPPGFTGSGIRIAILDTGVLSSHQAFAGRIVDPYGGCVGESSAEDRNGHGTATASQAGGTHGIAPGALIVPIKIFPGSGTSTDWGKLICGLDRVKAKGYEVANMSLAGGGGSSALQSAITATAKSTVLVAAAGNSGGGVGYPARYGDVIAVSGFDGSSRLASWSSRGSAVDIGAPGVNICGADIRQGGGDCSTGMHPNSLRSGTSRASPQVAGAAAVLRGAGVPPDKVASLLEQGGDCPGGSANTGPGNCPTGSWAGDGDGYAEPFLDVGRALALVNTNPLPTGSFVAPTNNETVAGEYAVRVAVHDSSTAACSLVVDVKIGAADYRRATCDSATGEHGLSWHTPDTADGRTTLSARITEPGTGSTTVTTTAIVDNVDDPPSVSWAFPTNASTVPPSFTAKVTASDDHAVTGVHLFVDNAALGAMTPASGTYTKAVGPLPAGAHSLRVDVDDGANATVQAGINITVADSLYEQHFDSPGSTGWGVAGRYQLWHISSSSCGAVRSAPNGVYYGREGACNYANGQASYGYLYAPSLSGLPSKYTMTVSSKRRVESCSGCSRDRTIIQVNYLDGRGWRTAYYRDARNPSNGSWETLTFPLGSPTGKLRVRFAFVTASSAANGYFGWAIDDFVLRAT